MTEEDRLRRAAQAGRKAVRNDLDDFRDRVTQQLAELDRIHDDTPEAAKQRANLIWWLNQIDALQQALAPESTPSRRSVRKSRIMHVSALPVARVGSE